ncbi:calcium-binding protein [Phaeobacter gallaeciensis]|uniref:Hemolysin-type calcium-binding protein repeat protein (2 copies) n=1 Tax=Phaeobacter gallaeciensis TaxID=60890 RepID=A0AAD0ECK9_9RHOB|nr:calcium-binding protein [Phaeobacter gallaeciensis]AHD09336.1 Hemolysin-type calcium-binding protein repeat protein (2 copies) [Phaeobacter gallaeciensis DSM 26640]ATE92599.1 Hemolysin-type calcium-binding protein repeat protein (2 copies) [Phaeobacter gallaeciensis]ATE97579.1 Hemolysin-type calcium-binding protein repeat protein (2 copies) [Phaeobacter gallaeciensis]ATF01264.1 Hemolysin-type calcium-binding protein repeat protein (2 copies) [Phaeobacter gallaeciensis]ATF05644.1 Hemolysin-t
MAELLVTAASNVAPPFDFSDFDFTKVAVLSATDTQIAVQYGAFVMVFQGSFSFDESGNLSPDSPLNGFGLFYDQSLIMSVSGFTLPSQMIADGDLYALLAVALSGDDIISSAWNGGERINGFAGNDTFRAGDGDDTIFGGAGQDELVLGDGVQTYSFTFGDSAGALLTTTKGRDMLFDVETVRLTNQTLHIQEGGSADEALISTNADNASVSDMIHGRGGNDTITGGTGKDFLLGGGGEDRLSGGKNDDFLDGGLDDDHLSGKAGDDNLRGSLGSDTLIGGAGNDTLRGDNDVGPDDNADDLLIGGSGHDSLSGNAGNDTLKAGNGVDTLEGGSGDDSLNGGRGRDLLSGGDGNDSLVGGRGNDTLTGGADHDRLSGGAGHDVMRGDAGNDLLIGGRGHDTLFGSDGADRLIGQYGNDRLTGGSGGDTFVFARNNGHDTITDFTLGEDLIQITRGANRIEHLGFEQLGENVHITFANASILVEGTTVDQLMDTDNFLF